MTIYKSFNKMDKTDHVHFSMKNGMEQSIIDYLKSNAVECYLKDDEIVDFMNKSAQEKKEYLVDNILPTKGSIKSGDFGEIFAYFFLEGEFNCNNIQIFGPKKWIWKVDKDTAAPFTDIVLCHIKDQTKPSPTDFIVSAESKMCATKPPQNKNRIQAAIDGAEKDKVSRLAETINWLKSKYERDRLPDKAKIIARFKDPVNNPYDKKYYAIAIFDESLLAEQILKPYTILNHTTKLYVISLNNLQKLYEKYFDEVTNVLLNYIKIIKLDFAV